MAYSDWGYDTFHQYVPVYEFFSNNLKAGSLSQYNFIYGLGSSTLIMAAWVADPFTLINILAGAIFGSQYIGRCLVFVQICKILCAGLLALCFLRRFRFSESSSVLAAYVYAFSGYMMTAGQHYFFSVYPVYYMLLLIMLENVLARDNKLADYLGLSGAVALLCLNGTQSAFAALSGAAVYFLVRLFVLYGKEIKKLFKKAACCVLYVFHGILFSALLFLPCLAGISDSSRLGQASLGARIAEAFSQADEDIIRSGVLRLFSNSVEGTVNSWNGGTYHWEMFSWFFSAIFVLLVTQYLWLTFSNHYDRAKKIQRLFPVAVIAFAVVNNFIPSYFNVFVYPNYRHVFIYLPLFALAFADTLDQIKEGKLNRYVNYLTVFASCVLIFGRGFELYQQGNDSVAFPLCVSMGTVIVGGALLDLLSMNGRYCATNEQSLPLKELKRSLALSLSLLVAVNLFAENYLTLYFGRTIISKQQEETHMLNEDAVSYIKSIEGENIYRFETDYREGRMSDRSYSFSLNIPTTSYYNTTIYSDFIEFLDKLSPSNSWYNPVIYSGLSTDIGAGLAKDILGVKYYTTAADYMGQGWEEIATYDNDMKLYQNTDIDSIGLLYRSYLTQEEADGLEMDARQYALYDSVILSDPGSDIDDYASHKQDFAIKDPNYIYDSANISAYSGTISNVETLGGGKTKITATVNGGTSIIIPVDRAGIDRNGWSAEVSVVLGKQYPVSYFCYSTDGTDWQGINVTTTDAGENNLQYEFPVASDTCYIGIAMACEGEVTFTITSQTMDVSPQYTNDGIRLSNPKQSKKVVAGTVSASENSVLFLPILYDESWHAYVDHQEVDVLKADYGFCAVKIPKGSHILELEWEDRAFQIGIVCTAVSIALTGVMLLLDRKIRTKMREKRKREK